MRMSVTLRRALPADADDLAAISRRAFDSDVEAGASAPGGPPGYDDPAWQRRMMRAGDYSVLLVDGQTAGGAIVFRKPSGTFELGRIFIDPSRHRQGVGSRAMALLFEQYPGARRWILDTPAWNVRTRAFYEGLGFVEYGRRPVGEGFDLILYELRVG